MSSIIEEFVVNKEVAKLEQEPKNNWTCYITKPYSIKGKEYIDIAVGVNPNNFLYKKNIDYFEKPIESKEDLESELKNFIENIMGGSSMSMMSVMGKSENRIHVKDTKLQDSDFTGTLTYPILEVLEEDKKKLRKYNLYKDIIHDINLDLIETVVSIYSVSNEATTKAYFDSEVQTYSDTKLDSSNYSLSIIQKKYSIDLGFKPSEIKLKISNKFKEENEVGIFNIVSKKGIIYAIDNKWYFTYRVKADTINIREIAENILSTLEKEEANLASKAFKA